MDKTEPLGPIYKAIYDQVVWLFAKRQIYDGFFADASKLDVLNRAGGFAMRVVQDCLLDDICMHITRLLDPAKSCGNENLCLEALVDALPAGEFDEAAKLQLHVERQAIRTQIDPFIQHRNKRLSHNDLQRMISNQQSLPAIPDAEVKAALESIARFLNKITLKCGRQTHFNPELGAGTSKALVMYLEYGLELCDLKKNLALKKISDSDVVERFRRWEP